MHDCLFIILSGVVPIACFQLKETGTVPNGTRGIDPAKVMAFHGDIHLGEGVAMLHTPGHTEGNHSLVCRVGDGIRVTSENGVGADSYAPRHSKYKAIREYARATGIDVIINGNTQEQSNDQYISMIQERTIAGPSQNPDFPNCVPSSEASPYWMLPGTGSTHLFGEWSSGQVHRREKIKVPDYA